MLGFPMLDARGSGFSPDWEDYPMFNWAQASLERAVGVAYENAAMNGIGAGRYTVRAGDVLSDRALAAELAQKRYQLVLANIVADVIIPLSAQVPGLLEPGGMFLCSGIIDTRADEVRAALVSHGLRVTEKKERDGWVAFAATR